MSCLSQNSNSIDGKKMAIVPQRSSIAVMSSLCPPAASIVQIRFELIWK